ncbi:FeS-binding protein [uncultured Desulfobacter sp.]|uniref:FeS-binding protein n=1 Tax=uncultured Desulfobacter sp. TaxID=240139 RepID=UPI0029F46DA1|nr:FeS-binding protein [uncultured Desulfobacter sp.]
MNSLFPRWLNRIMLAVMTLLALTGLAQMPIFKRYYIADIPGLGWLAAFYTTHKIHYIAAAVFLVLLFWMATVYLLNHRKNWRPTVMGQVRLAILVMIVVTGILRTVKNLPAHGFSPIAVMAVDWIHLAAVMLLGITAVLARVGPWRRNGVYATRHY